jgi:hypothetical protein
MKKLLLIVILFIKFQVYTLIILATPVNPLRILDVPMGGSIEMDGEDEIDYCNLQNTSIFNPTGLTGGDADFKADIKLSWDLNYLYLWAAVSDDIEEVYNWGVGNPWEFDNVEVFLQLDTNTVNTAYNSRTVQLRFCRTLDSVQEPGRALRSFYPYFCDNTTTGWVLETAIPWTCVLENGEGPEIDQDYICTEIGFDFSAADSDNSDGDPTVGNRDVQSAWDSDDPDTPEDRTEDNAWNNTSVFGRIVLTHVGCYSYFKDKNGEQIALRIFPNPAEETVQIRNLKASSTIAIYNIIGVKMMEIEQVNEETVIDISALNSGLFTAVINRKEAVRFVKE